MHVDGMDVSSVRSIISQISYIPCSEANLKEGVGGELIEGEGVDSDFFLVHLVYGNGILSVVGEFFEMFSRVNNS